METRMYDNISFDIRLSDDDNRTDELLPLLCLNGGNKLGLWGREHITEEMTGVYYEIPEWLAEGLRELVRNKIAQDKLDTVSQEK